MTDIFTFPARVYYEDTDAGGVVYHANYLKYMERGRTEWLRFLGFEQPQLKQEYQVILVVRHLEIDYNKPAYFNELLQVHTQLTKLGKASMVLLQRVQRQTENLCTAQVKIACLHIHTFRPQPLPLEIFTLLQNYV